MILSWNKVTLTIAIYYSYRILFNEGLPRIFSTVTQINAICGRPVLTYDIINTFTIVGYIEFIFIRAVICT